VAVLLFLLHFLHEYKANNGIIIIVLVVIIIIIIIIIIMGRDLYVISRFARSKPKSSHSLTD
jgi:heme/copper-type cytochrome/quinol oxidase subunit 4